MFEVVLLSAHQNWELLNEQAKTFRARYAVLTGLGHTHTNLQLGHPTITKTYVDPLALNELVCLPEIDVVLNSLVGFAGFSPVMHHSKEDTQVIILQMPMRVFKIKLLIGEEV